MTYMAKNGDILNAMLRISAMREQFCSKWLRYVNR